jgi:hypothetical protein
MAARIDSLSTMLNCRSRSPRLDRLRRGPGPRVRPSTRRWSPTDPPGQDPGRQGLLQPGDPHHPASARYPGHHPEPADQQAHRARRGRRGGRPPMWRHRRAFRCIRATPDRGGRRGGVADPKWGRIGAPQGPWRADRSAASPVSRSLPEKHERQGELSLPTSQYSGPRVLRQDPGRAAESPGQPWMGD